MDQEEAPPPYSAVDPLLTQANNNRRNANSPQGPIAGSVPGTEYASSSSRILAQPTNNLGASPVPPAQFTSAVAYFEGRPPTVLDDSRGILHHHMTIYPRSQAKDFPRRPRCWAARVNEVTQQDWDTFLRHLFPPHLGLAASSQHLPRQLRAEIQRDRKDRPQETDDERRARITAVVAEWNQCFFEPRATRIFFVYVAEPDAAPASALCPKCYPATTKVNQSAQPQGAAGSPVVSSPGQSNTVSPVPGQYTPSPTTNPWPGQPVPPFAHPGGPGMPFGPPFVAPPCAGSGGPPNNQPPGYFPQQPPYGGAPPWGWNHWGYQQPQYQIPGASKGGAFGWISSLASQAQKYGERFSEQAQQYGDQISAQAQHYSRQVEEQALAHARWLEEQARLREQKRAFPFGGNSGRPPWGQYPLEGYGIPMTPISNPSPQNEVSSENRNSNDQPPLEREAPAAERPRRGSVSSTSSESSLSSIDSLSTTSDLNASDLATVRAQLQALDDRHDRTLYDAAVDLRRQLSVLQESRHEARVSPRRGWLHGRRHHPHHNHHHQQNPHDWGRWESPEQQQRNSTERRAMKEEMRATRKAFKEVFRRARDEQREQKRARRRQHGRHRSDNGDQPKPEDQPLDRRLESLALDGSTESGTVSTPSESALHTQKPLPTAPPAQSVPGIESSGPSSPSGSQIRSQDSQSDSVAGKKGKSNEAPARLKEILKPRKKQRQQQQSTAAPSASSDVDDADANKTVKKDPSPQ